MRKNVEILALALLVSIPAAAWADRDVTPEPQEPPATARSPSISTDCALCFTCGGTHPIKNGEFDLEAGAVNKEFGSSCNGVRRNIVDDNPFLCCRP